MVGRVHRNAPGAQAKKTLPSIRSVCDWVTVVSDDIVTRLLPFINDEMRMPAGLIKDVIEEIERLQEELKNADDDFHVLKSMFDKMRAEVRGE